MNVYSRIQMMLFKARQKAKSELDRALLRADSRKQSSRPSSRRASGVDTLWRPTHKEAGVATNLAYAIA